MKRFPRYAGYFTLFIMLCVGLELGARILVHIFYDVSGKAPGLWVDDAELGAVYGPDRYNSFTSLNAQGFRNQEDVFEPKLAGTLRVMMVGGSTTFGKNIIKDEDTIAFQLERRIRNHPGHARSQVLNAGVTNFTAGHNLRMLQRWIPAYQPDYVILYEGINETQNEYFLRQEGVPMRNIESGYGILAKGFDQNDWWKRHLMVLRHLDQWIKLRVIRKRMRQRPPSMNPINLNPWVLNNYRHVLGQMVGYLKAHGVHVIVIRYAFDPATAAVQEPFSEISAQVAVEEKVLLCDMRRRFEAHEHFSELFIYSGVHVTPAGAEILANQLYQILRKDVPLA